MTGGYPGGQAEYVRVPFGDVNLLKVPDDISEEKVLFLSDILCTSWHANELADVRPGNTVAVWGAGPVGLLAAMWAKYRGASSVTIIDNIEYRLDVARTRIGVDVIDFSKEDAHLALLKKYPYGVDCCLDCVGFRYPQEKKHKVEMKMKLEQDCPEVVN